MKSIFITGISSGIGKSIAEYLSAKGYNVYGSVRKKEDEHVFKNSSIKTVLMDVTNSESISTIAQQFRTEGISLYALINNSGIAVAGSGEMLPIAEYKYQFDVNFFGLIDTTQQFIPLIEKGGRIINISSVSGVRVTPFLSPYAASKHAVEAYTHALRLELQLKEIYVTRVRPGYIKTAIWDKADEIDVSRYQNTIYFQPMSTLKSLSLKFGNAGLDPIHVSKTILKIIQSKKPKAHYKVVGSYIKEHLLPTYLPKALNDWIVSKYLNLFPK